MARAVRRTLGGAWLALCFLTAAGCRKADGTATPGTGGTGPGATGGNGTTGSGSGGSNGAAGGAGGGTTKPPPTLLGAIAFTVPSQAFQGQLSVGMSTTVPGAEIRYTIDRSLPTASSTLYAGQPLTITATTELRAQPFTGGAAAGMVSTALYVARDFDATSDLPLVIVDDYGQGPSTSDDLWTESIVMVWEPVNGVAKLSALPTLASRAGIHIHGSSSETYPRKSYRIELRDNQDNDADYPVMGMPAESDWVLIAPYFDRALLRNAFVYSLGTDMGLKAPRTRHAEVYINTARRAVGTGDYAGIYNFTETIKNAKSRLNLQELQTVDTAPPAVTGGYIMKFDWAVSEPPRLACTGSMPTGTAGGNCYSDLELVDPDPPVAEQTTFITNYVQQFHNSLHTTPFGDYASAIDLPSFVDYFIINELVRNLDEFTRSAYFHKDRDGKLTAGPLWDYNFSIDCGRATNRAPEGWQYPMAATEPMHMRNGAVDWYPRLVTDPAFMAKVGTRWKELRQNLLTTASLDARLNMLATPLTTASARDFARWPVSTVFGSQAYLGPTATTWTGQVQALHDWLPKRMAWMDTQFP